MKIASMFLGLLYQGLPSSCSAPVFVDDELGYRRGVNNRLCRL